MSPTDAGPHVFGLNTPFDLCIHARIKAPVFVPFLLHTHQPIMLNSTPVPNIDPNATLLVADIDPSVDFRPPSLEEVVISIIVKTGIFAIISGQAYTFISRNGKGPTLQTTLCLWYVERPSAFVHDDDLGDLVLL